MDYPYSGKGVVGFARCRRGLWPRNFLSEWTKGAVIDRAYSGKVDSELYR